MVDAKRKTKSIKNNPKDRDPRNQGSKNQGFPLSEMIEMIEEESRASDISDDERHRLTFLYGFLRGISAPEEGKIINLKASVRICRRIKLKYAKSPSGKIN